MNATYVEQSFLCHFAIYLSITFHRLIRLVGEKTKGRSRKNNVFKLASARRSETAANGGITQQHQQLLPISSFTSDP
jgi:hypothetical protein